MPAEPATRALEDLGVDCRPRRGGLDRPADERLEEGSDAPRAERGEIRETVSAAADPVVRKCRLCLSLAEVPHLSTDRAGESLDLGGSADPGRSGLGSIAAPIGSRAEAWRVGRRSHVAAALHEPASPPRLDGQEAP